MPFASLVRRQVIGIAVLAIVAFDTVAAFAQSAAQWPERPVRLLVPVGAGGAADALSRNSGERLSQLRRTGSP